MNWHETYPISFRFDAGHKRRQFKWISQKGFVTGKFSWQAGYGAFSYSKSHVDRVIDYIKNQEKHHGKKSFMDEYRDFLEKFEVNFDERYIFKEIAYEKEE